MTEAQQLQNELSEEITLTKQKLLSIITSIVCSYTREELDSEKLDIITNETYSLMNTVLEVYDEINYERPIYEC